MKEQLWGVLYITIGITMAISCIYLGDKAWVVALIISMLALMVYIALRLRKRKKEGKNGGS